MNEQTTDEQKQLDVRRYRESAEVWGETAARALAEGDAGAARTATRQAVKYARVAMQLENGERWFEEPKVEVAVAVGEVTAR